MLDFKILYKFFKKLPTKKKKNTLFLSIIISNLAAGVDILIAYLLSLLLNNSVSFFSYSFSTTKEIGWLLFLFATIRFVLKNYEDYILRKFQYTIQSDLLNLYIEKLFSDKNVSLSDYFYKLNTEGERLSRVGFGFGKIGFHSLQILVFLAFLLYENYIIFLVFVCLLIASIPFARFIKKVQSKKSLEHSEDIKNINELGEKYVSNYFFIKSLKKETHELSNFKKTTNDLKNNLVRLNIFASISYHLPTTVAFMSVSILIIMFNDINISEQSLSLIVILRTLTSVGSMLISVSELNNFSSFVKNYVESASESQKVEKSNISISQSKNLSVKNTNFEYSDEMIFENLNIEIKYGEKLLITGPNGSGKSTFIGILMGIFIPQVGNLELTEATKAYIGPKPFIFNESLRNNLIYSSTEEVNDLDIERLIEEFQLFESEVVDLNKNISSNNLSSGQMQKICFIRTLLQNPDFIFLDEATTNLDKEAIEIVIQKLKSFSGTLIIVSHEPELFSSFTKEYKIKNKNLAEL